MDFVLIAPTLLFMMAKIVLAHQVLLKEMELVWQVAKMAKF